ncbi:DNA-binding XRE family transcriptional regulator [Allocatelliglobosispora scoriae]|uniref:DNA-binding XRE family transcriptional regulator n=1 Tax=Allocatelliglobosispora scoriae TaxID=643052 RepID=A0A841BGE5_9ACTN|nr:helix-turn-helix domain-containing protein [Allocatelliglobosispora scoriae]MBB5866705.1 DNA-binding XRE family transcriptional regulator [Allocatelliglobosispora scoriae]
MEDPNEVQQARKRLGARLALLRAAAGFTQHTLAAQISYGRSTIANVEVGKQKVRRDFWQRCDAVLGEESSSLTAEHNQIVDMLSRHQQQAALAAFTDDDQPADWDEWLRHSMLTRARPPGELPSLESMESALNGGNAAYQRAQYAQLRDLPAMVRCAEALVAHTPESARAATIATSVYLLVAKLATKRGAVDVAWVAADRAATFSLMTRRPELRAVAAYQTACALAKQPARVGEAEDVALSAAGALAAHRGATTPGALSARGALLLHAAIAAARQGRRADAEKHLDGAETLARQLGRNANELWTAFGPANVALHRISVAVALNATAHAIGLADRVDTAALPPMLVSRRAQLHLDLAAAHLQTKADPQSLLHLLEFERIAPEAITVNRAAQGHIQTLLGRWRASQTPGLPALAARAGVQA